MKRYKVNFLVGVIIGFGCLCLFATSLSGSLDPIHALVSLGFFLLGVAVLIISSIKYWSNDAEREKLTSKQRKMKLVIGVVKGLVLLLISWFLIDMEHNNTAARMVGYTAWDRFVELLGYVIGVVAMYFVVGSPVRYWLNKEGVTELSDEKKCPFCAEQIKAEAIVCRYCGKDLPASAPVAS